MKKPVTLAQIGKAAVEYSNANDVWTERRGWMRMVNAARRLHDLIDRYNAQKRRKAKR